MGECDTCNDSTGIGEIDQPSINKQDNVTHRRDPEDGMKFLCYGSQNSYVVSPTHVIIGLGNTSLDHLSVSKACWKLDLHRLPKLGVVFSGQAAIDRPLRRQWGE